MYNIKVMGKRTEDVDGEDVLVDFEDMYQCGHYGKTTYPLNASEITRRLYPAGVEFRVEMACVDGPVSISMPEDGQELYVMNEAGDTIDSYKCEGAK